MNVGVYVDAFNLYYGMRSQCGRGTPGWRWLDIRAMVVPYVRWRNAVIDRIVYCTARVDQQESPKQRVDQDIYINALQSANSITAIEEGRYVSWAKTQPLAANKRAIAHPALYEVTGKEYIDPLLPLSVVTSNQSGKQNILATVRNREEKGSDVNVAAHLLKDVFTKEIDAAIVITNDSDLGLPLSMARVVCPVGLMVPSGRATAGTLCGSPTDGVGGHWWRRLQPPDFLNNQLPSAVGAYTKPADW